MSSISLIKELLEKYKIDKYKYLIFEVDNS